jgi:hypothetical protein
MQWIPGISGRMDLAVDLNTVVNVTTKIYSEHF